MDPSKGPALSALAKDAAPKAQVATATPASVAAKPSQPATPTATAAPVAPVLAAGASSKNQVPAAIPSRPTPAAPHAPAASPPVSVATPQPVPTPAPASAADGSDGPLPTSKAAAQQFIAAVAGPARQSQKETGVPAAVTIAQAILESDWGQSLLSTEGNNFFGIKAITGPGPAGTVSMDTWEVQNGQNVTVQSAFKAYHNLGESVQDHGRFLVENPRYSPAFKFSGDPAEFARQIAAAGYATDPAYPGKLIGLMQQYGLAKYDTAP